MKKKTNPKSGLTTEEIEKRREEGRVNYDTTIQTKTIQQIIRENLFTPFNCLNLFFAVLILAVQSYKNLLFMGVVISNSVISIVQEIRSKKVIDKLSIIAAQKIKVLRNQQIEDIELEEIVEDDVLILKAGNQIICDSFVLDGEIEVNESLLTGESDSICKKVGDSLLSGSFVVSGSCKAQVVHVGEENYAAKISADAKNKKELESQIMKTLNKIVKTISVIILPLGIFFFFGQRTLPDSTLKDAIVHTVAALIVMVPEGLVLLTSVVLAVSIIRLAKHHVLVQDLYCIETLARVDTICLDKTGTLTEGEMEVSDVVPISSNSRKEVEELLGTFAQSSVDENATMRAIRNYATKIRPFEVLQVLPFSSEKKYSAVEYKEGSFLLGAPEFLGTLSESLTEKITIFSKEHRIVAFFQTKEHLEKNKIPDQLEPIAFILLKDKIRKQAASTLNYFKRQDVAIKIISGDHVSTVSNIAKQLKIEHAEDAIDVSTLKTKEELREAALRYTIFGRVTPLQKKEIVLALQQDGHTVAMTGDGVNDVLALKEANCSIAMASGSDAARNVSELVLLEDNFDALPAVVAEGRRSINNIERSSTLFLTKTIYATLLAIFFLFIRLPYPFQPIQLSLISTATIGIPSFLLAMEPNRERVTGTFLKNILHRSFPTALVIFLNIVLLSLMSHFQFFSEETVSTLAVFLTATTALMLLFRLCLPFNYRRRILFYGMIVFFFAQFFFLQGFYSIGGFHLKMELFALVVFFLNIFLYRFLIRIMEYVLEHSKLLKRMMQ